MKICSKCKTEKEEQQFGKDARTLDGLKCWCIDCDRTYKKEYARKWKAKNSRRHKATRDRYQAAHKAKIAQASARYREMNPYALQSCIIKKYWPDMSGREAVAEYMRMFELQGGRCKLCGIHRNDCKKNLSVDHDHKTGKVRGLLCQKCNIGIGLLNHEILLLEKAITYLKD